MGAPAPAQVRRLLRQRSFRTVWFGEMLALLGDFSFTVVFVWLVFAETGSAGALAAIMMTQAVPRGVLLLLGGAVTDRWSPRTVMFCSHLTRGAAVGLLGLLALADSVQVWHLYALGLVAGVAEAFYWPSSSSILPSLVPAASLDRANAMMGFSEQIGRLLGPALGGVLIVAAGAAPAVALTSATFFAAALSVLAAPRRPPPGHGAEPVRAVVREIVDGLGYARRSREIRTVLLLIGAATLSYSGLFAVGLPALAQSLPGGALGLSLLLSAWGLGQLVGTVSAVFTGLPRRWGLLIICMTLVEGAAFAFLGFLPHVWLAAALLAVLGVGVAYSTDVALPTFVQTRTPPEVLGRISSVLSLPRVVLEPVSLGLMGLLVTGDVRWGFVMAAVPMVLVGLRLAFDRRARSLTTAVPEAA
ncbi:MFS transporter [Nocardiopsis ganjiahuensis]|uniref:MFS transporter n=1 Tax=Nocardiopsis ganjiahuensis TaxID=239984 RepID=UPI0003482DE6|nr:MFS transporter [Nocardiopsis ganjiahuensis]